MSQEENFVLPDGRKTSELKVNELKKELEKFGKRKVGTKAELILRLNEALSASLISVDDNHIQPVDSMELKVQDDSRPDAGDNINQSMDTLEIGVPMDESLNPMDNSIQEDQIQINLSKDEEADMVLEVKDDHLLNKSEEMIIMDKENNTEGCIEGPTRQVFEHECDEVLNIELDTTIELYEGDNMDLEMEVQDSKKRSDNKDDENITVTVINVHNNEGENADETEEGEVVTVPITARLGKRKVREDADIDISPRKAKKKGLKETKGAGHIIEEPIRVQSPTKSKNIISNLLRVDNLVRPFTMTQLQDVFSIKGKVVDLWLNKIKSFAYVKYEDESTAINARESLDGCKWPSINPKLLVADFATYREMEWMKEKGDSGQSPPAYLRQPEISKVILHNETRKEPSDVTKTENRERRVHDRQDVNQERRAHDRQQDHQERRINDRQQDHHDRGAVHDRFGDVQQRSVHDRIENNQENKRRSYSPDRRQRQSSQKTGHKERGRERSNGKAENSPASKLLEDLFRKTVAQPSVYWLPVATEKNEGKKKTPEMTNVAVS